MKKNLMIIALGLAAVMPAKAQWTNWNTSSTISGVFGVLNHTIESAERKKAMEIHAKEKAEYEKSFKDAMESAKDYEGGEYWEDALGKYEEAAKLNCNYGYSDQQQISRKISELYVKAGRTEEGPSILNNAKVTLSDYSKYRYVRENPVYVNKKVTNTKIVRVACSDTETRLELEYEASSMNVGLSIKVIRSCASPSSSNPCLKMRRSSTSSSPPAPGSSRISSVGRLSSFKSLKNSLLL